MHYTTGEAGAIIKFASDRLKKSKEFMLKFIKIAPYVLDYIPKELAKDKDIKLLAKNIDKNNNKEINNITGCIALIKANNSKK